jgi:hypothetical protein
MMMENQAITISMKFSESLQLVMASLTFLAILVALFGEKIRNWFDRPKLAVEFASQSERCCRAAEIEKDLVQDESGLIENVTRRYYRLRVNNTGGTAKRVKAKIDVLDSKGKPAERFEPNLLRWVDWQDVVDLASGESHYVNLFSVIENKEHVKNRLRLELADTTPRGIAWDRQLVVWILKVSIYGDNIRNPLVKQWRIDPAATPDYICSLTEVNALS